MTLEQSITEAVTAGVEQALRPYLRRLIDPEPLTYSIPQAAVVIGTSEVTVRRLVNDGHLPIVPHIEGRRLIPRRAVEALVNFAVDDRVRAPRSSDRRVVPAVNLSDAEVAS